MIILNSKSHPNSFPSKFHISQYHEEIQYIDVKKSPRIVRYSQYPTHIQDGINNTPKKKSFSFEMNKSSKNWILFIKKDDTPICPEICLDEEQSHKYHAKIKINYNTNVITIIPTSIDKT